MAHFTLHSIQHKIKHSRGADFNQSAGTQAIATNTWTKLTNNTLGSATDETLTPLGSPTLYDRTNNRLLLDPFMVGSVVGIRVDANISTVAAAQLDIRLFWQGKDIDGDNTTSFSITKTLGQTLAGTTYNILEAFEITIDGEDQRRGYIEIQIYVAGTTGTFQMIGVKIHRK